MENHPIPQDVTGFKFKLIGSMTVKQFLYLLAFGILATVSFVLHISFFIRIPFVLLFSGIGCALAFLPIEGRPMDVMIANFAKTVPSENRYIFRKKGASISSYKIFDLPVTAKTVAQIAAAKTTTQTTASDKHAALISRLRNSPFRPDQEEVTSLKNIHSLFEGKTIAPPQETKGQQAESLPEKKPEAPFANPVHENPTVDLTKKENLTETVRFAGDQAPHELPKDNPTVVSISEKPNPTLAGGFPTLPDVGNAILGIVRDPRAKPLPNIIVEVMDKAGTPVRAFKTNSLGQFAAATPLPNGSFIVHLEDPAKIHEFKDTTLELSGQIVLPIEATSIDAREKLRQELFGAQPAAAVIGAQAA